MAKWCFNYESGEYEYIEKDGFSIDRGEYVCNWDDSQYRREEEECRNSLYENILSNNFLKFFLVSSDKVNDPASIALDILLMP